MKFKVLFFCGLMMTFLPGLCQTQKNVLYIVDSVPALMGVKEITLTEKEIDTLNTIKDHAFIDKYTVKEELMTLLFRTKPKIDEIIFITTREYAHRSVQLRQIPTTKRMDRKDGKFYLKKSQFPYSGPFIDYFFDGSKESDGFIKEGLLEGVSTKYNKNGSRDSYQTFKEGLEHGHFAFFIQNDNRERIVEEGDYKKGWKDGIWRYWYSTGKLCREERFIQGKRIASKEEKKLSDILIKGVQLSDKRKYEKAIEALTKAIELDPNFIDAYYCRGVALSNVFKFDDALADFDKALEIEPLFISALWNRAITRMKKYESENTQPPKDELEKICKDLSVEFEDKPQEVIDALSKYCKRDQK